MSFIRPKYTFFIHTFFVVVFNHLFIPMPIGGIEGDIEMRTKGMVPSTGTVNKGEKGEKGEKGGKGEKGEKGGNSVAAGSTTQPMSKAMSLKGATTSTSSPSLLPSTKGTLY